MVSVVDVTLENAPAPLVRRDQLSGRVHYFCSEYCEERDLAFLRQEEPDFDQPTAKHIFRQVMRTVKALHARKWYHQDIKLENIFVARDGNNNFQFKIGDFGRLTTRDSEAEHEKGR
jgi:serine/threonine protein kinase